MKIVMKCAILVSAFTLISCTSNAPDLQEGDMAWQSGDGRSGGSPALLAMMDAEQATRGDDQLMVEWVPYVDPTTRLAVPRAPVGMRIVTPGSTLPQDTADAWLPWR